MKKASLFFLTLIATTAICIAGCGKDTGAREIASSEYRVVNDNTETKDTELLADSTPTSTPNSSDTNSSDTDVDLNQEEDSIPEGNPEDESAARYGTGNFDEYWMGEDYFDLYRYMSDNGFEVIALDSSCEPVEVGEEPSYYQCNRDEWMIGLGLNMYFVIENSSPYSRTFFAEYTGEDKAIDVGGCLVNISYLQTLPVVIENIKNNQKPFMGLDESYRQIEY